MSDNSSDGACNGGADGATSKRDFRSRRGSPMLSTIIDFALGFDTYRSLRPAVSNFLEKQYKIIKKSAQNYPKSHKG